MKQIPHLLTVASFVFCANGRPYVEKASKQLKLIFYHAMHFHMQAVHENPIYFMFGFRIPEDVHSWLCVCAKGVSFIFLYCQHLLFQIPSLEYTLPESGEVTDCVPYLFLWSLKHRGVTSRDIDILALLVLTHCSNKIT